MRTCLLHFIVAFLLVGDNELIRRLADTKGKPPILHLLNITKTCPCNIQRFLKL